MLDVFLLHSPSDSPIAAQIAERLERCAEAKLWTEALDDESFVPDAWDGGLTSGGILVLLGPDSVPARVRREEWQSILDHAMRNAKPPIAFVLTAECPHPPLLQCRNFFRWAEGADDLESLRLIERWAIGLHASAGTRSFAAAGMPWFRGCEAEMDLLLHKLVDCGGGRCSITGKVRSGKSSLAQEFVRRAGGHFRETIWVACGDIPDAFVLGDLAAQLGVSDTRDVPRIISDHRLLIVFDDVRRPLPTPLAEGGIGAFL